MEKQNCRGERRKAARIAAALLGAGLLAMWLLTGESGLSEEDIEIYEQTAAMQDQVDGLGFLDFRLEDYPVAMYDGKWDYVIYQGEIKKRAPVLETFAGTVYPVEDHFEVVVPTVGQLDQLLSLAGGVEGMVSGNGYDAEEQTAAIWHEAFHAYQLTNYAILGEWVDPEELRQEMEGGDGGEGQAVISEEEWIVEEVDKRAEIRKQLETEPNLLEEAAELAFEIETAERENSKDIIELKKWP